MGKEKRVKYGGISFSNNVPPEEINSFIRELPYEKRDSLFEAIRELESKGLITVDHYIDAEEEPC